MKKKEKRPFTETYKSVTFQQNVLYFLTVKDMCLRRHSVWRTAGKSSLCKALSTRK